MKKFRLIFDMDGTIADLYSEIDWLHKLQTSQPIFRGLKTIGKFDEIREALKVLKEIAPETEVVICSWLPMYATVEYSEACTIEKMGWLRDKGFDEFAEGMFILPYGTNKQIATCEDGETVNILFDDNAEVRAEFTENTNSQAFDENQILPVLRMIIEIHN
jgi:hypothetical protein